MHLIEIDPWLAPFASELQKRGVNFEARLEEIKNGWGSLANFATSHDYFGLHRESDGWILREWAPNAKEIYLIGDFSNWKPSSSYRLQRYDNGVWMLNLPQEALKHGDLYKLWMVWQGGEGTRIPSHARRVVQDSKTLIFSAQVWEPPKFNWSDQGFVMQEKSPIIYEAHPGMAQEDGKVGSYKEFTQNILPRIKEAGYNMIQLMAVQEHPYYGSFGYHVSNFFAPSSRFGTPDDLKQLVNSAHEMGISVIMDLVHSHSVKNVEEGLSFFDGTHNLYFHDGDRGNHPAWDSRCFDYGKKEVQRFLLSNCKYWLDEYHFDGFRFDGITSMLYYHHGLEKDFTSYSHYFNGEVDDDAVLYLTLANMLIHETRAGAISVAEEMSGLPGLTSKAALNGLEFDFRLSMGVPDFWIKLIKELPDEKWRCSQIFHELSQHRPEERVVSYSESHDQALVGDKTIIFRLADKEMYYRMSKETPNLIIDRAIALHKMIRLVTLSTANGGYLNFMGNEFGHPEWIDFPREGNGWSYKHARRQWSLYDNEALKFRWLGLFDKAMISMARSHDLLSAPDASLRLANDHDQVLAFERANLLFVFNFNPVKSFTGYGIPVKSGKFKIVLTTDMEIFGGFNRVDCSLTYYSSPIPLNRDQHQVMIYIPSRTAIILERQQIKRVHE